MSSPSLTRVFFNLFYLTSKEISDHLQWLILVSNFLVNVTGRVRVRIDSCFTWTLLLKNDYRHTVSNYSCRIMCRILCICLLFAGLMGLFCSPILLCQVSARMGEGCMFATCCQGALIGLRIKLRTQQNIQVNQCAMMLFTNSVNFP